MILLVRFIGNVAAIWVASKLLDGVTYGGEWQDLLLAALVVSLVMLLLTSWDRPRLPDRRLLDLRRRDRHRLGGQRVRAGDRAEARRRGGAERTR